MTAEQLDLLGITTNSWVTLKGLCNGLIFSNEDHLFANGSETSRYYFDTTNDLVYVKQLGRRYSSIPDGEDPDNFIQVSDGGNTSYARILPGGLKSKTAAIGIYHTVYDLTKLSGSF